MSMEGITTANVTDVHRLNLVTNTWSGALTCGGTAPRIRYGHRTELYGSKMYVFGGTGTPYFDDLYYLDLETLMWAQTIGPPVARFACDSIVYNGYIYVFGGANPATTAYNEIHMYNLSTGVWSNYVTCTGTAPTARWGMSVVLYGTYLYVFGGQTSASAHLNDLHRLNLSTLAWSGALSPTGTAPTARSGHKGSAIW